MGSTVDFPIRSKPGDPVWELATLYPAQGRWTESEYLNLTDSRRGIEYVAGRLEFLPMPTRTHQEIIQLVWLMLTEFLKPKGGAAWFAGIRVRTAPDAIREPDVVAMLDRHDARAGERLFDGADLVVEVVSDSREDRRRDLDDKRREYAAAGIPEYWIVDPQQRRLTVLALKGGAYAEHSAACDGESAESSLLQGFKLAATPLFDRE